jgi:hypothetical protein
MQAPAPQESPSERLFQVWPSFLAVCRRPAETLPEGSPKGVQPKGEPLGLRGVSVQSLGT